MSDIKAAPLAAFPPPNEVNSRWCFDSSFAPDTALILINSGLGCPAFLRAVWACASLRVAADGAATRLWRTLLRSPASCGACGRCACASGGAAAGAVGSATLSEALAADAGAREVLEAHLPDLVCGDWDSIDAETEAFLRMRGVPCAPQPEDQDSTDLEKCLRAVHDAASRRAPHGGATGAAAQMRVLVYGAFGGRFDQEAQNLNCLYKWCAGGEGGAASRDGERGLTFPAHPQVLLFCCPHTCVRGRPCAAAAARGEPRARRSTLRGALLRPCAAWAARAFTHDARPSLGRERVGHALWGARLHLQPRRGLGR